MFKLSRTQRLLLALSPGLLFWLAWHPMQVFPLVFVAFVPLFILQEYYHRSTHHRSLLRFWGYTYLALLIWNVLTTWWIWNAAGPGSIPAFGLNTLLMTIPWILYFITRKKLGDYYGLVSFIAFWLSFEYLHMQWEITWPWLTLGNIFAPFPPIIQWYEFTGHLGGSLWILAVNILCFKIFTSWKKNKVILNRRLIPGTITLILLPMLVSAVIYFTYEEKGERVNVTVVQPNVDPYNHKFSTAYFEEIWRKLFYYSMKVSSDETQYLVWPETSVPGVIRLNNLEKSPAVQRLQNFLRDSLPRATLVTGIDAFIVYDKPETPTARKFRDGECCFDGLNAAMQIDASGNTEVYYKSKLVPGVERMPYPQLFGFLENFAIDLGGTSGSLATQKERVAFVSSEGYKTGPIICYESVFGEFVTEYVKKGAQALFIVTNDAWWYNTPGHKQHLVYASLRSIETRKSIARSANTGISCFINQRGDILQATKYEATTAINQDIYFNEHITFYTRYGDLLARILLFMSLYFLVLPFMRSFRAKRNISRCM